MTKHRRRKFFLPNTCQVDLLLGSQLILFVLLVVIGYFFYDYMYADLEDAYFSAHQKIGDTMDLLFPGLFFMCTFILILAVPANIFFTHKIAGPAFHLSRVLREIGNGNLNRVVHFRKHDSLTELADSTNRMIEDLSHRLRPIQSTVNEVCSDLEALEKRSDGRPLGSEEVSQLLQRLRPVRSLLNDFRLKEEAEKGTGEP